MRDFLEFLVVASVVFAIVIGASIGIVVGLSIANAHWSCSSYASASGATTQVIAGECYVQDSGKWVLLGAYVGEHNVNVRDRN